MLLVPVKMKVNKHMIQAQHKVDYILEIDAFFNTHYFYCKYISFILKDWVNLNIASGLIAQTTSDVKWKHFSGKEKCLCWQWVHFKDWV